MVLSELLFPYCLTSCSAFSERTWHLPGASGLRRSGNLGYRLMQPGLPGSLRFSGTWSPEKASDLMLSSGTQSTPDSAQWQMVSQLLSISRLCLSTKFLLGHEWERYIGSGHRRSNLIGGYQKRHLAKLEGPPSIAGTTAGPDNVG